MDDATLTVRISIATKRRLDSLADRTRQDSGQLAADAIEAYLATQTEQADAVGAAVAAADAGAPFYEYEAVMRYLQRRAAKGSRTRRPKPAATP